MNKATKKRLSALADFGCILCHHLGYGATPAQIHHMRTGTGLMRASDDDVIPLCHEHHQGPMGIHGMGRRAWEIFHRVTEVELLEMTRSVIK